MKLNKKRELGQFFTSNSIIIRNILNYVPNDVKRIVDPFSGDWDLLKLFDKYETIGYDIDVKNEKTIQQDTLNEPPKYNILDWVVTNPPYLAKNKTKDKRYYEKYDVDDLYKASIKSIEGCGGGIIVLPIGFFTSRDNKIREYFFNLYEIWSDVNVFEYQVFDDTTTCVCSFAFKRKLVANKEPKEDITFIFWEDDNENEHIVFNIVMFEKYGYKIGGEIQDLYPMNKDINVNRLMKGQEPTTNMKLYCLDSKNNSESEGRIRLQMDNLYFGKISDRTFATIQLNIKLTEKEQRLVCFYFNNILESLRFQYRSLFLSSYRELTRKRITYKLAYLLINYIIDKYVLKNRIAVL